LKPCLVQESDVSAKVRQSCSSDHFSLLSKQLQPDYMSSHHIFILTSSIMNKLRSFLYRFLFIFSILTILNPIIAYSANPFSSAYQTKIFHLLNQLHSDPNNGKISVEIKSTRSADKHHFLRLVFKDIFNQVSVFQHNMYNTIYLQKINQPVKNARNERLLASFPTVL